jgi:CheY-like chemotaxis protein
MNRETLTILVVDDEAIVRLALEAVLKWNGYQVLQASDGDEALDMLQSTHVDLLLTDLAMPGREGIETIIEARRRFPRVKVIALSGVYGGFCLDMARQLGAAAALAKPFTNDVLIRTVDATLNRSASAARLSAATTT